MDFKTLSEKHEQYVIDMRREFHMYPELSYKEVNTSKIIMRELEKMNIPYDVVDPNIVIAFINKEKEGKTIAIRGDIDALPMQEENDVEYKSKIDGVMHSCGHDAHAAMLLGVAKMLDEIKDDIDGSVMLIFQVAEEIGGGSLEILDYFSKNKGPDRIIATHVWVDIKSGEISVEKGARMAGGCGWEVIVNGKGGHGSRPDQCLDPIKPACDIALKLSSIPVNFRSVLEPCVVTTGAIHGGTTIGNIIPASANLKGSYRYFSENGREEIFKIIKQIAEGVASSYGVEVEVKNDRGVPPVINDEKSVNLAKDIISEMNNLEMANFDPICASDCYGMILRKYPGFYCYLGVGNEEKGIVYPQHHPKYEIDEDALKLGCEFMAKYACKFINEK